jgi:hypothetical protein
VDVAVYPTRLDPSPTWTAHCSIRDHVDLCCDRPVSADIHSALMPAALMIGHHFSISAF